MVSSEIVDEGADGSEVDHLGVERSEGLVDVMVLVVLRVLVILSVLVVVVREVRILRVLLDLSMLVILGVMEDLRSWKI